MLVTALRKPGRCGKEELTGDAGKLLVPHCLLRWMLLDREGDGRRKLSGTVSVCLLEEACDVKYASSTLVRVMLGNGAERTEMWDMMVKKGGKRSRLM